MAPDWTMDRRRRAQARACNTSAAGDSLRETPEGIVQLSYRVRAKSHLIHAQINGTLGFAEFLLELVCDIWICSLELHKVFMHGTAAWAFEMILCVHKHD